MTFGIGIVALNNPIASTMGDAQIQGAGMTLADRITYDVAAKAASGGVRAFIEATELIVDALAQSMSKFIEIELMWGNSGLGTLGQASVAAAISGSSVTCTITIDTAEWAAGIWSGFENIAIDVYDGGAAGAATGLVKINTLGAITVTSVVASTRVITLSGQAADISAIVALNGTALQLFPYNAYGNEMNGYYVILANTGTLFNIAAGTYALWQSNTYSFGSTAANFGKIQSAVAQATSRGLMEDVSVFVNPTTFANIVTSQAGARRYDSSWKNKELENGAQSLAFLGSEREDRVGSAYLHEAGLCLRPAPEALRENRRDRPDLHPAWNAWRVLPSAPRLHGLRASLLYAPGRVLPDAGERRSLHLDRQPVNLKS